jgi:hypothetical protein
MPALFVTSLIICSGCNKNERGTDDENIIVPGFDLSCFGGDGGIRIIEKTFHSVNNTQNRHFQAYILCKPSSVSPLFLLLTTSIVVKTVVNIPNDSVHKCVFVDYNARYLTIAMIM